MPSIKQLVKNPPTSYFPTDKQFVFICGLHRSGTSALHKLLAAQPAFSGFEDTGFPEDEGQFAQSVFKTDNHYGGPGRFGFNEDARLTEKSVLYKPINRRKLKQEWGQYWDLSKSILVEKSPSNLLRMRFLQAVFPNAKFIIITRHPIAVSYATQKWSKTPTNQLLRHWLAAHRSMQEDLSSIRNYVLLSYEELVSQPTRVLLILSNFLGKDIKYNNELGDYNQKYFDRWHQLAESTTGKWQKRLATAELSKQFTKFGYSLTNLELYPALIRIEK